MKILIEPHTLERAEERGTTEEEIKDVVDNGFAIDAKYGRLAKAKTYPFNSRRCGNFYQQKRVEVIFTIQGDTVVTVTVYVFYGNWESRE
jgi:hypothetical protein